MVAAFLLPIAFSAELYHSFWAPKAAVCLVLVGPGLAALAQLVRGGNRPAILASSFLVAASLSALWSGNLVVALTGAPNWGTGLVFVAALAASWALGVVAGTRRRDQILMAVVAGAGINAMVAWLQARGLVPPALESEGRSMGLMGNPVHLGALVAGAVWLVVHRVGWRRRSLAWVAPLALLAGAAQLSGGRSAVGLTVLATLAGLARSGVKRGAAILAAAVIGMAAASAWAGEGAVSGSGRVVGPDATAQVDVRGTTLRVALDAALERPVLGWGPGRFQAATSPRSTAAMSEGGVSIWKDAHNWVAEYAVTTGFVGLALLGAWLVAAGRASGGPLVGFAVVVGLFMLVEPQSVGVTPLAFMALGASSRGPAHPPAVGRGLRLASTALMAAGFTLAAVFLVGEAYLRRALLDTSVPTFERGAALVPPWADVSRLGARIQTFGALHSPEQRQRVLALARQATRRDPTDPSTWSYLAQLELVWGSDAAAGRAATRALERNPWLLEGLSSAVVVAKRTGDEAGLAEHCRRLKILGQGHRACGGPATVLP